MSFRAYFKSLAVKARVCYSSSSSSGIAPGGRIDVHKPARLCKNDCGADTDSHRAVHTPPDTGGRGLRLRRKGSPDEIIDGLSWFTRCPSGAAERGGA